MMAGMSFKFQEFFKMEIVNLPKILDLVESSSLLEDFMKVKSSSVSINAENVTRVGAQCMQILISAQKNWKENDLDFILNNPSEEFLETMLMIGISQDDLTYRSQNIGGENKR